MQRALDGVLRRLVAQHQHRLLDVGLAARLRGHVEELPGDHLAAHGVEERESARPRRPSAARRCGASRRTTTAAGRRAGSPPRRRTARGVPTSPARGAAPRRPCASPGRPRRVSEASMKSSWTSALACSSSSDAAARTSAGSSGGSATTDAEAPVAEGCPEPLAARDRPPGRRRPAAPRRRPAPRGGPPARRRNRRAPTGRLRERRRRPSWRSRRRAYGRPVAPGGHPRWPAGRRPYPVAYGARNLLDLPGRPVSPRRRPDRCGGALDLVRVLPAQATRRGSGSCGPRCGSSRRCSPPSCP